MDHDDILSEINALIERETKVEEEVESLKFDENMTPIEKLKAVFDNGKEIVDLSFFDPLTKARSSKFLKVDYLIQLSESGVDEILSWSNKKPSTSFRSNFINVLKNSPVAIVDSGYF